jgi:hypothetical protein
MDRTRLRARQLDRERARNGPEGDLTFYTYEQAEGLEALLVVSKWWGIEQVDAVNYKVTIIEQEQVTAETIYKAVRCTFGSVTISIPADGIKPPTVAPRAWVISGTVLRPMQ